MNNKFNIGTYGKIEQLYTELLLLFKENDLDYSQAVTFLNNLLDRLKCTGYLRFPNDEFYESEVKIWQKKKKPYIKAN